METGDPLVDQQHRDIHRMVDEVEAAGDRPDELMRVLERLMDYVASHFLIEEDLMRRSGYDPVLAARHIAEHHELADAARSAVLDFRSGELVSMQPLARLLRDWLSTHVHQHDRVLIEFVRERAISAELPVQR
jgi:hemerythrin-like metal-binding protein